MNDARKYLKRQFGAVAWLLLGYYLIMNILAGAGVGIDQFLQYLRFRSGMNIPDISLGSWGYVASVLTGLGILLAWKDTDFWEFEVWARGRPMRPLSFWELLSVFLAVQLISSLVLSLISSILLPFGVDLIGKYESLGISDTSDLGMFLYASLLAPIFEEILFRGVVQRSLMPFGKSFAVFGSAFLFGMFHGNPVQTPFAFAAGLVLGYVAAEYSIGWSMLLHMVNNLVIADMLPRLTSGLPEIVGMLFQSATMWLFGIAGIAVFFCSLKKIRAWYRREPIDHFCLRCFLGNFGMIVFLFVFIGNMVMFVLM